MELAPEQAGLAPDRLERITEHLDRHYIEPGKIAGCQVLVARHGHTAYARSLGNMDRERARPMADDTIFRIYSMTKPITSIALMTLYEHGHFQIDDPIHRFIPEMKDQRVWVSGEGESMETRPPVRPTTFRHVLSHTGGLTYGVTRHPADRTYLSLGARGETGAPRASTTLGEFARNLAQVTLRYDPGERWIYSFSTDVCAALVEAVSGVPFDQYLQETIFNPLGMRDTGFSVPARDAQRFAANYRRNPDKTIGLVDDPQTSRYLRQPTFLSGGGGLVSTMADYHRFAEMLRRGGELDGARVIGSRTLKLMTQNHLPGGGDLSTVAKGMFSETAYEGIGFGLGFAMTLDPVKAGSASAGDFYWGGAASTIFWVDPNEDLVAIFMTQLMPSNTFNFRGQLKSIIYSAIVD